MLGVQAKLAASGEPGALSSHVEGGQRGGDDMEAWGCGHVRQRGAREEGLTDQVKKLCVYSKSRGTAEGPEANRRLDDMWGISEHSSCRAG